MKTSFQTHLKAIGNNTGIEVPPENMAELGSSKKPAVWVDVQGYRYQSTVAVMGTKFMIALSAAHRSACGIKAGDAIHVTLTLDLEPRDTPIPTDLSAALEQHGRAEAFAKLAPSKRKEAVRQLEEAKTAETRQRRLEKMLSQLG